MCLLQALYQALKAIFLTFSMCVGLPLLVESAGALAPPLQKQLQHRPCTPPRPKRPVSDDDGNDDEVEDDEEEEDGEEEEEEEEDSDEVSLSEADTQAAGDGAAGTSRAG